MLLIQPAMTSFPHTPLPYRHHFVIEAVGGKDLQMSRQDLIEWIIGYQTYRADLNHRPPCLAPFGFWKANHQHCAPQYSKLNFAINPNCIVSSVVFTHRTA